MVGASVRRCRLANQLQNFQGFGRPSSCCFAHHRLESDAEGLASLLGPQVGSFRLRVRFGGGQRRVDCFGDDVLSLRRRHGNV